MAFSTLGPRIGVDFRDGVRRRCLVHPGHGEYRLEVVRSLTNTRVLAVRGTFGYARIGNTSTSSSSPRTSSSPRNLCFGFRHTRHSTN